MQTEPIHPAVRVGHVHLRVADLDRSIAFYGDALGLGVTADGRAVGLEAAFLAAGCGKTVIDDAKTEAAIEQNLEDSVGKKVTAVDCPSDVEVEKGDSFACQVTLAGGKEETATMKILNEDADIELSGLEPAK